MLISSLLSNSESWYNLTPSDISRLEVVDESLLRKVFSAHSKTPKELLYLESGNIPVRYIIKSRRLNFLWYILNEDENSLLRRFFVAQCDNPVKGDWVKTINKDLEDLEINLSLNEIQNLSKSAFKNIVKEKSRQKAFQYLTEIKNSHSKSKELVYHELSLQDYLKPGNELSIQDKKFIFAARSNMLELNANFKNGKSDISCRVCGMDEENQRHLMKCSALSDGSLLLNNDPCDYQDINGRNTAKISLVGKILMTKFKKFRQVHSSSSDVFNRPKASAATDCMLVDLE